MPTMKSIDQLVAVSAAYRESTGIKVSTLSFRVFRDGNKLPAILDKGADITTSRFEAAMVWFSDNWPDGLGWPDGVPRPAQSFPTSGDAA